MYCVLMKAPNTAEVERKPGAVDFPFNSHNDEAILCKCNLGLTE